MKEVICWFVNHKWKLVMGSEKVGWGVFCQRCQKSITGDY